MAHLLARLARAVLLWLLGRQPTTRARRALAWATTVVTCAFVVQAGVLGACLAVVWWLLAQLAALIAGAGAPLALVVAVLAGARPILRRVIPPPTLADPPASAENPAGPSDIPFPSEAGGEPGSSDTGRPPSHADVAAAVPQPDETESRPDTPADDEPALPDSAEAAAPLVEDPLAVEAAWLEAHWAGEAHPNGSAPPARAPAST